MAKFVVSVTETLNRLVCVEAKSPLEARSKAYDAYLEGIVVLNADDKTDDVDILVYSEDQGDVSICKNFIR